MPKKYKKLRKKTIAKRVKTVSRPGRAARISKIKKAAVRARRKRARAPFRRASARAARTKRILSSRRDLAVRERQEDRKLTAGVFERLEQADVVSMVNPPPLLNYLVPQNFSRAEEAAGVDNTGGSAPFMPVEVLESPSIISARVGKHAPSAHLLDLNSALSMEEQRARHHAELNSFFGKTEQYERPGRAARWRARVRGFFSSGRDHAVLSPSRPRIFKEIKDELLLFNLIEVVLITTRWIFAAYFSALVFLSRVFWRVFEKRNEDVAHILTVREKRAVPMPLVAPFKAVRPPAFKIKFGFLHFAPPARFERALASFVLISFIFIMPLRLVSTYQDLQKEKSIFAERSVRAFEDLRNSWKQTGGLEGAAAAFENASKDFDQILADLEKTHRFMQSIASFFPQGDELDAGKSLLEAGSLVAGAAEVLAGRLAALDNSEITTADKVHLLKESIETALPLLVLAREKIESAPLDALPAKFNSMAVSARTLLNQAIESMENARIAVDVLEYILGRSEPRRFLVIFQNNTELRPTGGFVGSFAEADISEGNIIRLWMPGGGSYDLQGSLRASVVPPEPLQLITDHWQFHDSNWFADFPSSARKMMWFYEKSGGPTVDGVLALTNSAVEKLLRIIGPIEMPEYDKVIDADNFWLETQKAVEIEYDKSENKPKKFLADLAPKMLQKLQSGDSQTFLGLARAFHESVAEKHLQIYLRDAAQEEKLSHLGWSGELKYGSGDSLAVINTNIAGGKTDASVDEHIKHATVIDEEGKIKITLEVARSHRAAKGELFRGVRNVDYVRIYVPEGSTLLSARGFGKPDQSLFKAVLESAVPDKDIESLNNSSFEDEASGTRVSRESGHTVFGNWVMVDPGETATYSVVYELPFRVALKEFPKNFWQNIGLLKPPAAQAAYSFMLFKQAGSINTSYEHSLELPDNFSLVWSYPSSENNSGKLDRDRFFGAVATARPSD